jgi:predicted HD superfamily hydrolase involved in NAD metabolism
MVAALEELRLHIQRRVEALPQRLQEHIGRVQEIARELAPLHDLDPERAALGMLAHDVARAMPGKELLGHATALGLPIALVDLRAPVLLHGPVGAELLRRESGLDDASLYQAVYWHTTAHPTLDTLGKVVFLADKLDPPKARKYPYQPQLHQLAMEDLDRAILEFLTRETLGQLNRGGMVHPMMVETRNSLLYAGVSIPADVAAATLN